METIVKHRTEPHKFDGYVNEAFESDFPCLWQFPKEFRRNWFQQLNLRFVIILIATSVFEIGALSLFLSRIKSKDTMADINLIQRQYANLLVNKLATANSFVDNSAATYLYGIPDNLDPSPPVLEERPGLPLRTSEQSGNLRRAGTRKNGSNDVGQGGTSTVSSANHQLSNLEARGNYDDVNSKGILQYIISGNNPGTNEELTEIFTQNSENVRILESSLANLKLKKYAPSDRWGKSMSAGSGSENTSPANSPKISEGGRVTVGIGSSLAPLEKAEYKTVVKNTELEDFSVSVIEKTGAKAYTRKADQVTKVVLSHNRSIQDCFKQALKIRPDLKGKVVVRFMVAPGGWVERVDILQSTIDFVPMLKCITNRINNWKDFGESDPALGTVGYRQTYVFGY